ncbi:MAG: hypothetical protein GX834_03210 [Clostridiaceae bacterium]|nr:hypothetical protein [Clostridiaceae bacterium]
MRRSRIILEMVVLTHRFLRGTGFFRDGIMLIAIELLFLRRFWVYRLIRGLLLWMVVIINIIHITPPDNFQSLASAG